MCLTVFQKPARIIVHELLQHQISGDHLLSIVNLKYINWGMIHYKDAALAV